MERLDESRQIELATMVGFLEEDEKFLDTLLKEAGQGVEGDYEKFKISMGRYWLKGAREYIESVVDTWFDREEMVEGEVVDEPAQVVTAHDIKAKWADEDKEKGWKALPGGGVVSTKHDDACTCTVCVPRVNVTDDWENGGTTIYHTPKPWTPPYKDEDKIVAQIRQILKDTPKEEWSRVGFKGWLTASASGALGGKADPKLILDKVIEVVNADSAL